MTKDEIIDQVRRAREELASKHDYKLNAILLAAKKRQRRSGHEVVTPPAKRKLSA